MDVVDGREVEVFLVPTEKDGGHWHGVLRILKQDGRVVLCPVHETRTPRTPPPDSRESLADSKFLETNIPLDGLMLGLKKLITLGCRKVTVSPIGVVRPSRA